MEQRFTLFIDESGEAGISKIRSETSTGASPYMTLGASLISNSSRASVETLLNRICSDLGKKSLHCSQLRHYQILHFARTIRTAKMRLFGVISRKGTLGRYKSTIEDDSTKYYNKCAQYLLERVGYFMENRGIPAENLDIVFEKANIDYDKMRNFLWACHSNPKHPNTQKLKFVNLSNIRIEEKKHEPLLQIADLVAHALYKCVDKQDRYHNILEPRYLKEISSHFFGHPDSQLITGGGLYCVHSLKDLKLDAEVHEAIETMAAKVF